MKDRAKCFAKDSNSASIVDHKMLANLLHANLPLFTDLITQERQQSYWLISLSYLFKITNQLSRGFSFQAPRLIWGSVAQWTNGFLYRKQKYSI